MPKLKKNMTIKTKSSLSLKNIIARIIVNTFLVIGILALLAYFLVVVFMFATELSGGIVSGLLWLAGIAAAIGLLVWGLRNSDY